MGRYRRYQRCDNDYVVKYSNKPNSKEWVFLCLLCGRNLGGKESIAHVISYEHAKNFLEKAHCGSLDCGDVSRETLLDLAEQAAKIHPVSEIQMINLDVPLLDFEYLNVVQMLQTVKWRQSNCELIPVLAAGKKLCKKHMWSSTFVLRTPYVSFSFIVPSETLQEVDGGHVNAETQVESKETTTESGNLTPKIEPNSHTETAGGLPGGTTNEMKADEEKANEANPEITLKCHIKCESEANIELDSHPAEQIKEEPQMMKEEEAEASEVAPEQLPSVKQELNNPSLQSLASSPKREPENDGEEARVPKRTASTSTQTYGKECKEEADTAMPGKRKASGSSDQEVGSKRPRLCPGVETEPLMKPSGDQTGMDHRNATEKVLFKDVPPTTAQIDEGLTALIECHCEPHAPIYLCTCCCLKIPEEKIVLHIIGFEHQKDYLVVELTPDMYSEMVWQSYDVALEKIQAYQNTLLRSPPAPQVQK
ncbi:hypothetical protein N1851_008478 [Merluccius polli]|uniref:Uncharacterized protein n=1 Tax=Merluccius polli TaxID=89951 RepID=A0AA47N200_MERPO|nr:hypothetical protein N1851_008478 [Merluccius polli]